jgi:hypothetical protein
MDNHHGTEGDDAMKQNSTVTAIGICLVLALAGCAQTMYVKDGGTPQEFEADKFDCEHKVVTMYGGYTQMGIGHAIMARQDMQRCIESKGYRQMSSLPPEKQLRAPQPGSPEDVWMSKSGGAVYPKPTSCVGQGCVPSTGQ